MKTQAALYLSTVTSCLLVSACSWVDSTGSQGVDVPVIEIFLDDLPLGSNTLIVNEKNLAHITTTRDTTTALEQTFSWSEPLQQGNLASCAELSDFNANLAAGSLADACTNAEQCSLAFEHLEIDSENPALAEFNLLIPELKAPVGIRYSLAVTDLAGRDDVRELDFCLVAINEAPTAENDTFVVLEGERKVVTADERNLLTNDEDDIDESNAPLSVLTEAAKEPGKAEFFKLETDGGFTYESNLSGIRTDQYDTFDYHVTDGVHTSKGTATIRIVAANQAPEIINDVPVLTAIEGVPFEAELFSYFRDPEEAELKFTFSADSILPTEGTLSLSEDGVLSGIADEEDVGTYEPTLIVSDGGTDVERSITLLVEAAPVAVENGAPEFVTGTVFNQTVDLGNPIEPITPGFIDPDGDPLTYAIVGASELPDGVEIDEETGIVSGVPETETFVVNLRIEATDPSGESASSGRFFIRVR